MSGKSGYLVAAAVLHAQRGAYHEACSLMLPVRDPAYRYLTALLCYDAGYHEKHRSLYPESLVVHSYPAEESLLLSDSLYRLGLVDDARHVWQDLITVYPGYSPIPYYNLSKTSSADGRGTTLLSDCLDIFPAYYPAIALYTHAVRSFQDSSRDDPVAGALRSAGFSSMRMDADADIERPDAGEALRKIARGMRIRQGFMIPVSILSGYVLIPIEMTLPSEQKRWYGNCLNDSLTVLCLMTMLWYFYRPGRMIQLFR